MSTELYIEPLIKISYSSFYIQGLYDVFGKKNVHFSADYFKDLDKQGDLWSYDSYMAVVMIKNGKKHNIIIDFGDDVPIRKNAYQWCHVYAKINYFPEKTLADTQNKIVVIPPGFAIKTWNALEIFYNLLSNLYKINFRANVLLKNYCREYISQFKQLRLNEITAKGKWDPDNTNYIFLVSTLWNHQNCLEGTNLYRKTFMETAKKVVDFEGGFLLTEKNHPQEKEFKHLIFKRRTPFSSYIAKTKNSAIVFNTPAVHNCHGWKLGQYLAMGKAIISMPLQNVLPAPL